MFYYNKEESPVFFAYDKKGRFFFVRWWGCLRKEAGGSASSCFIIFRLVDPSVGFADSSLYTREP